MTRILAYFARQKTSLHFFRWSSLKSNFSNKESFFYQFIVSFSSATIVTILGFLLSPINSRLYKPEAYGVFSVFSVVLTNLTILSTLNYPGALLLPKTKFRFKLLVQLCMMLTIITTGFLLLSLLFFRDGISAFFNLTVLGGWIFLLPGLFLLTGIFSLLNTWFIKSGLFNKKASVDIVTNLSSKLFTVGFGFIKGSSPLGFILGEVTGKMLGSLFSFRKLLAEIREAKLFTFRWKHLKMIAVAYKKFPLYTLPSTYINIFSSQLPILMLNRHFSSTIVGWYAFTTSILELPINLLGSSVAPVFVRKAVTSFHEEGVDGLREITEKFFLRIFYLGVIPFSILAVFGDYIFSFVFGPVWLQAGRFAAYLGIYFILRIIYVVLVNLYGVLEKQHYDLVLNCILICLRFLAIYIGIQKNDINLAVLLFSVVSTMITGINIFIVLRLLGARISSIAWKSLRVLLLAGGVFISLRLLFQYLFQ